MQPQLLVLFFFPRTFLAAEFSSPASEGGGRATQGSRGGWGPRSQPERGWPRGKGVSVPWVCPDGREPRGTRLSLEPNGCVKKILSHVVTRSYASCRLEVRLLRLLRKVTPRLSSPPVVSLQLLLSPLLLSSPVPFCSVSRSILVLFQQILEPP